jgi:hypothetical protein
MQLGGSGIPTPHMHRRRRASHLSSHMRADYGVYHDVIFKPVVGLVVDVSDNRKEGWLPNRITSILDPRILSP